MNAVAKALLAAREFVGARRRFRSLRGDSLVRWQDERGTVAAAHALAHSPFWRERARGRSAADWRSFPIIEKSDVTAHFDDFNTAGLRGADAMAFALRSELAGDTRALFHPRDGTAGFTVGLSSGTSGHRSLTILDEREQTGFVGFMLARLLDGALSLRRHRVAFFMRSNSAAYEAAHSPLIDFRFFDLTLSDDEICARLTALDPHIVLGPPAMLGVVAELVTRGKLAIRPRVVLSGAEVLEPQQRAAVESALGVVVRDVYHTSEGLIAVSCRQGRLHLQEDIAHIELEPILEGSDGGARYTPIQTQFFRRVLPVLRYRMNDVVTLDDRACPCGSSFRVLARIEGRADDVFLFPRADGSLARVFPDTLRTAILQVDGVREYRAEQVGPDRIRVCIDGSAVDATAAARLIAARVAQAGACPAPLVDVELALPPEPDKKKKLVRVRRLWKPDARTLSRTA